MTQEATEGIFRIGIVQDYDAKRHMARIVFPGMGNLVSGWLPVIVPFSNGNKAELHLDIGSHVACIMAGEGVETGIIAGTFYDDTNAPDDGNPDITALTFSDGTAIRYDRKSHQLDINGRGDISITCSGNMDIHAQGNVTITGANIYLN